MSWLYVFVGLLLLLAGAEILVRGASRLALAAGLSPLVTGLTVVAFGTSAPELFVSVGAALEGRFALAAGNVLGSNIFNVFAVLGVSAIIAPLAVERAVIRFDVPAMAAVSLACWLALADGTLADWECLVLLAAMVCYLVVLLRRGKAEPDAAPNLPQDIPVASGKRGAVLILSAVASIGGTALLAYGADMFVDAAAALASSMGVSEALIGSTVAAAGTSLPELATSAMAAFKGQRDMAVGNVVGSNLFNIMVVLAAAGLMAPAGTAVLAPQSAFDLPVMVAAAFLCLPVFITGSRITRAEGMLFLAYFGAYLAARVAIDLRLDWGLAVEHNALPLVLAATGLVYAVSIGRSSFVLARLGSALPFFMGEAHSAVRKAVVLVAGTFVLLAGVIMLVTPGPGIAAIVLGLVILASEFMWAKTLLTRVKTRFHSVAEHLKNGFPGHKN